MGGGGDEDASKTKKGSSTKNANSKLDKIAIKKLKPMQLKEALKECGLKYQGNVKVLMDRLLEYEANR